MEAALMDEPSRDPLFRNQYECGVVEVPEFEAALQGSLAPRISIPPVTQPLQGVSWMQPLGIRLK